ncbi:MAG: hypothetical protein RQ899_12270 [Pseudomonadales bacterium]|nr:hypothetical protein [Pseudomonadales bacterium]
MDREQTGRFYNSFIVKVIRDFSLLLALLLAVETSLRLGLSLYDYYTEAAEQTAIAADQLAGNVKDIMLNSGGPVASRTIYPILHSNYQALGFSIALTPSETTRSSMRKLFDQEVHGIPSQWPPGERFQETTRVLQAEPFCLGCHVDAQIGESLGEVTVRRYLHEHLAAWWHEVQLTGLLTVGKLGLDILVLFLLLRVRMEPLMNLRAVVGALTQSNQGLSRRAEVHSNDEFGELGMNINDLLDRITTVMGDLLTMLNQVVAINGRLTQSSQGLIKSFAQVDSCVRTTQAELQQQIQALHERSSQQFHAVDHALAQSGKSGGDTGKDAALSAMSAFAALKLDIGKLLNQLSDVVKPLGQANEAGHELRHYMQSIEHLEERLSRVTEEGRRLLTRLS